MRDTPKRGISLYLRLTLAFSAIVWSLIIWSGHLDMALGLMIPAIMWCPAIAALLTCRLLGRPLASLGWRWPGSKYLAASYLLPVGYTSLAYGMVWAGHFGGWNSEFVSAISQSFGLRGLPTWCSFMLYVFLAATGGVIQNLGMTLGEEIGWRGFLVPELAKSMSFTKIALVSGFVWSVWHSPLLLFADYNVGTNRGYELVCSTITCVSLSFVLAWLRLKSDSLWPAALLHASHNLFIPGLFDNLIRDTGSTLWYTTQFGSALAVTGSVVAVYFWARRAEIDKPAIANVSAHPAAS